MANNTITTKARYWVGVGYPENMRSDWQETIGNITQMPYAYCIHDKDKDSDQDSRKTHIHIILVFPNTTTYKNALNVFNGLSESNKRAFNTIQKINNIRFMYNYLIHDTEDCKKKHKHLYDKSERITGNEFDIGSYEQMSINDKKTIRRELSILISKKGFMNYLDFYNYVVTNFDTEYEEIVVSYSGHFERLTKGNFQKWRFANLQN